MKTPIPLILASCLALASYPTFAEESGDDWKLFGGMLSLIQSVVHAAATTDDPQAVQKRVDALLAGRDAEANQMPASCSTKWWARFPRSTMARLAPSPRTS